MSKALGPLAGCCLALAAHLCGCAEPPPPEAPRLRPPPAPADAAPLTSSQALVLALRPADPADTIRSLDREAFAFELDEPTLRWFEAKGVVPDVLGYLRKRSKIDWAATRGDIPDPPPR